MSIVNIPNGGPVVYELNGMILDQYLNMNSATVHTSIDNFRGIMGLSD